MKLERARRNHPPLTETGFDYIVPRKFHTKPMAKMKEGKNATSIMVKISGVVPWRQ